MRKRQPKLFEGLRAKDLKNQVDHIFTIDQYKSKMGEDKDVVVVGFRVADKYPAIDLMEFIEKGYTFILDADMSTGEERDGKYQVFVELERTPNLGGQLRDVLEGVSQLCDCYAWKFRYHKEIASQPFSPEAISEHVPSSPEAYESKLLEYKGAEVKEFFNQGSIDDVILDEQHNVKFIKPYSESLVARLVNIGSYEELKDLIPGAIQLDETSRNQTVFLEKYLGNYEIHKINDKFLIRNGDRAVILQKETW
jgi:hypothetical protein